MKAAACLPVIFLCLGAAFATAQTDTVRLSGVLAEDSVYNSLPPPPSYTGEKYDHLPVRTSFRRHCPAPGDQGSTGACASWAAGYGALTILHALKMETADPLEIQYMAFSPLYLHNQAKRGSGCFSAVLLSDVFRILNEQGDCRLSTFNPKDCDSLPGRRQKEEAANFKTKSWQKLFETLEPGSVKTDQVRKTLGGESPAPVVVALHHDATFWLIPAGQEVWQPDPSATSPELHALVVVGYDDVTLQFECLNSYGTRWGDRGFIYIGYEDFGRLAHYGFVMSL